MNSDDFTFTRYIHRLPERAPIRWMRPEALPQPSEVRARLTREGIDPDSASAILSALLQRGWASWLIASPPATPGQTPRFRAYVLDPRYNATWAEGNGKTPAEAYGAVLVCCLDEPPWEREGTDE